MRSWRSAVLVCLAPLAAATTTEPCTTCSLVGSAERVCCAVCDSVEARLDPRSGMVFTHASFRLLEDFKGRGAGAAIRLRIVGGRVGQVATVVHGMPEFRAGEECVLFLGKPNDEGFDTIHGAARGVVRVRPGPRGERFVASRVDGFPELHGSARVALGDLREAILREARALELRRAEAGR